MLKISRLADYSTVIMNFLGNKPAECFSAAEIAHATNITLPTVSKILKLLNEADLLTSMRGTKGGYQLARQLDQITIAEIVSAIDGKPAITQCSMGANVCIHDRFCELRGNWQTINQLVFEVLNSVSLADMRRPLRPVIN